jgi:hypothetical protein
MTLSLVLDAKGAIQITTIGSDDLNSVLPAPSLVNFPEKLLFLVPFTISVRFYPSRILESSAKPYASALVRVNPV